MVQQHYKYDIALVNMPFAMPNIAPLGIGVLCGALRRAGMRAKCFFGNIDLAERVPDELYAFPASEAVNVDIMLGDWLFADQLFGEDPERDRKFMDLLAAEDRQGRVLWNRRYRNCRDFGLEIPLLKRECRRVVEKLARHLTEVEPAMIVGCSSTFFQRFASLALLKRVKELSPGTTTFLGGADCEGEAGLEAVRRFDFLDYLFSGEGDLTVPEMSRRIVRGESGVELPFGVFDRPKALSGIVEVATVPADDIAEPDHSDFYARLKAGRFWKRNSRKYFLESSRGCWKGERQHCSFCGLNGERICYRCKSADRVLEELRRGYREYDARVFLTADTVLDINRMKNALEQFASESPDALITYETVSTYTAEQMRFLAECGVLVIQSGVETLHPAHIRLLNKGNSTLANIAMLKYARENNMQIIWNMLTGIPGDKAEDYRWLSDLIPSLFHLAGPNYGGIRFDRFSMYSQNPQRYNLELVPMKCYGILIPDGRLDLNQWALFYDNMAKGATTPQSDIIYFRRQIEFWQRVSGRCLMKLEYAGEDRLLDTRCCALCGEYQLTDIEHAVLEMAYAPVDRMKVERELKNAGVVIERLKEYKYLIEVDGRLLALPVHPPSVELLSGQRRRYRNLLLAGNVLYRDDPLLRDILPPQG